MRWLWAVFDGAKSHAVPEDLFPSIVEDMLCRGCSASSARAIDPQEEVVFDLPGMMAVDRPHSELALSGLNLRIPCQDVGYLAERLRGLEWREVREGLPFVKLHGFLRCLVLDPEMRTALQESLDAATDDADRRDEEFFADLLLRLEVGGASVIRDPDDIYHVVLRNTDDP